MPAIETTALTKRYGEDILAVDGLDLTVEEGEIFGFLGPNGAGKSTTINMLLDFVRPSEGRATVLGYDAQDETGAIRERIGVLPEGATLYERLTAREHVEWVADTKRSTTDVDAILDRVGILEDADRAAGGFSKGMRQRLGLGMALVGDPDLLILDEPSSGLDPNGIQDMRQLLREEAESGTTVFFSSHILSEVEAVCDRVGIMNQGRLVALDSIATLRDEATGEATIEVELASPADPESLAVDSIDGVRGATVEDGAVTAVCETPGVKVDVVRHLDQRATVTDILSSDTSLEELFNQYTGETDALPGDEVGTPDDARDREPEVIA
ncbi:ATP-binding cassette domain-containing protein [Natronorubrum sp. JWXQ-INN-674]|uniref:ATP-binding cassette domain-containing protein n=1 Tax=Natronorubrum halalkaliphilum TaxID=2691917 RepID=A0A6B0VLR3_9EURY|nr:ABC transporter ATP-binding protein [Natronorubrum halalkaliphilum]MXV61712.1 ATP-binding cassette domain-containing protein [Natronorubrum halalkaliphilum]